INTCLDTNDFIRRYDLVIDELLDATDLVDAGSETRRTTISTKALVGVSNWRMLECARYLAKRNQHTWVGYVIVPVWSDDD
ncbi:MAG: pyruvate formate lyase 1-activating protein, partial [Serratia symbiotica]|nr:pyruvate formate lyase 1-activating protein [Serratia symbiotica]